MRQPGLFLLNEYVWSRRINRSMASYVMSVVCVCVSFLMGWALLGRQDFPTLHILAGWLVDFVSVSSRRGPFNCHCPGT